MLKKEITPKNSRLTIGFKCKECLHFAKHPKFEKLCSKLGVLANADAPACFTPNVYSLQKHSPDVMNHLGLLIKDFSAPEARILIALLRSKKVYERYGLAFGMPVYVRFGADFLGNYYRGYVIGVAPHGEPMVYVTSDMNRKQSNKTVIMALLPDSILTISEFKKKRDELIANKKLKDPNPTVFGKPVRKKHVDIDYEPPTLETVPTSWFDAYSTRTLKDSSKKLKKEKDGSLTYKI